MINHTTQFDHIFNDVNSFADTLRDCFKKTTATDGGYRKEKIYLPKALKESKSIFKAAHKAGNKVIFIGNGGSAGIASHLAIDYCKNAKIRSIAFNDAAALTCMSNDYGYKYVFAKQLEFYGRPGDVVVAISSSGKSVNIIEAAAQAKQSNMGLITLSGMDSENPLRGAGDINYFVPSDDYGVIEITHLTLLHTITSVIHLR